MFFSLENVRFVATLQCKLSLLVSLYLFPYKSGLGFGRRIGCQQCFFLIVVCKSTIFSAEFEQRPESL